MSDHQPTNENSSKKLKGILINLAVLGATLAATLIAAEVVLRILGIDYPHLSAPDPYRFYKRYPYHEYYETREGQAEVKFNGLGFRDKDHKLGKQNDEYRIAVLGDSFTEAVQVPVGETYWSLLSKN